MAYAVMQIHCRESMRFDDCLESKVIKFDHFPTIRIA